MLEESKNEISNVNDSSVVSGSGLPLETSVSNSGKVQLRKKERTSKRGERDPAYFTAAMETSPK